MELLLRNGLSDNLSRLLSSLVRGWDGVSDESFIEVQADSEGSHTIACTEETWDDFSGAIIRNHKHIVGLSLVGYAFDLFMVSLLIQKMPALQSVRISGCRFPSLQTSILMRVVGSIKELRSLEALDISNNDIGSLPKTVLIHVFFLLEATWKKLTSLNLACNNLGEEGALCLSKSITSFPFLQTLKIGGNALGPGGTQSLTQALGELGSVTRIGWSENAAPRKRWGSTGVRWLQPLFQYITSLKRPLETLSLSGNRMGVSDATALAEALFANTKQLGYAGLGELDLAGCSLGWRGLAALGPLFGSFKAGALLDLGDNDLGPKGFEMLASLLAGGDPGVIALDVGSNSMGKRGAAALAAALVNSKTELLTLRNNKLQHSELRTLVPCFGESLAILDMSHNRLGPQGASVLADAIRAKSLQGLHRLCLAEVGLGAEGARILAAPLGLLVVPEGYLCYVDLRGNSCGAEGAAALSQALLPAGRDFCKVSFRSALSEDGLVDLEQEIKYNFDADDMGAWKTRQVVQSMKQDFGAFIAEKESVEVLGSGEQLDELQGQLEGLDQKLVALITGQWRGELLPGLAKPLHEVQQELEEWGHRFGALVNEQRLSEPPQRPADPDFDRRLDEKWRRFLAQHRAGGSPQGSGEGVTDQGSADHGFPERGPLAVKESDELQQDLEGLKVQCELNSLPSPELSARVQEAKPDNALGLIHIVPSSRRPLKLDKWLASVPAEPHKPKHAFQEGEAHKPQEALSPSSVFDHPEADLHKLETDTLPEPPPPYPQPPPPFAKHDRDPGRQWDRGMLPPIQTGAGFIFESEEAQRTFESWLADSVLSRQMMARIAEDPRQLAYYNLMRWFLSSVFTGAHAVASGRVVAAQSTAASLATALLRAPAGLVPLVGGLLSGVVGAASKYVLGQLSLAEAKRISGAAPGGVAETVVQLVTQELAVGRDAVLLARTANLVTGIPLEPAIERLVTQDIAALVSAIVDGEIQRAPADLSGRGLAADLVRVILKGGPPSSPSPLLGVSSPEPRSGGVGSSSPRKTQQAPHTNVTDLAREMERLQAELAVNKQKLEAMHLRQEEQRTQLEGLRREGALVTDRGGGAQLQLQESLTRTKSALQEQERINRREQQELVLQTERNSAAIAELFDLGGWKQPLFLPPKVVNFERGSKPAVSRGG